MGLEAGFVKCILPIAFEMGKCIFYLTMISGAYVLMRGNASESIKKIKMSALGYVMLRCVVLFVNFVDRIADTISF